MLPQPPCTDKYGANVCNLFETAGLRARRQMPREAEELLKGVTAQRESAGSLTGGDTRPTFSTKRNSNLPPPDGKEEQTQHVRPRGKRDDFTLYRQPMPTKSGFAAAQAEIDSGPLRGWTIDTELSSREGLVLIKGEEIRVAYRGTEFNDVNDLVTDAAAVAGYERLAPQMVESRLQIEAIQDKYGKLPNELLGYSKGGAHAMAMGDRFGIPTTSYNPLVGRRQMMNRSEVPHTIIRTVEDPVSTLMVLARGKKNYTVKSIDPIQGLGDPKSMHALTQFTSAGPRQPGGIDALMTEGVRKGQQLAHFETLDAMTAGVEQGKTFTEALDDFNRTNGAVQRVDVLEDGSLGPRIHGESGTVQYWRDAGGAFTPQEQAHLDSNPPPPQREYSDEARAMGLGEDLTQAQRSYVVSLPAEERAAFMQQQRTSMQQHTQLIDTAVEPHRTVVRAMMPRTSSLATGVAAGVAANATMNAVDPEHKMNRVAEEATEGAIAGGIGVGVASALGASAALGPEVLAGASAYVAGSESGRAITTALEDGGTSRNTAEAVGSVSGGAIGGVAASTAATGAAIAGSMLLGAEAGEAVGLVGGPVGMAVGAAGGATIGAVVGGIGYLFSHHW